MPRWLNILPIALYFLAVNLTASASPAAAENFSQDCEASFVYQYLEGNTVVFFNTSPVYDSLEWVFNGEPFGGIQAVVVQTFTSDTNYVCLRIWDADGCEAEQCLQIYPGAPGEMCQVIDCVWPGDADGNGKANQYDLLNIGLGYGQTGPERPFFPDPDNHIAWAPNFSWDWGLWLDGINYKHLDCDGDGFIDEADVEAIIHNYAPELEASSIPIPGAPPVYLQFDTPLINLGAGPTPDFEVTAGLFVGAAAQPIEGLHGLALHFSYPLGLIEPLSVEVDYETSSFFGPSAEILTVEKDLATNLGQGRYDLAFSRKSGSGTSGFGRVATVRFIVNGDIIDGRPEPEIPFIAEAEAILIKGFQGDTLAYGTPGPDTVLIVKGAMANNLTNEVPPAFQVFPIPASEQLSVRFSATGAKQISLLNLLGQPVLQRPVAAGITELELSLAGLPKGLYLLIVDWAQGRTAMRVAVE